MNTRSLAINLIILTLSNVISTAAYGATTYSLTRYTMDSTGFSKSTLNPNGYALLDSVGQSTPIGVSISSGNKYSLEAGFIYATELTKDLGQTTTDVIAALDQILVDPVIVITPQDKKKVTQAIKFLNEAMAAFAVYESTGDQISLINALNKSKQAIANLISSGTDTAIYQEMIAAASKQAVKIEITKIESGLALPDSDPNIIQARIFQEAGSTQLLNDEYEKAVQTFVKALNEALLAV